MRCFLLVVTFCATSAISAQGIEQSLFPGDKAPAIDIEHWLTPGMVETTKIEPGDGNIYVIDFWATWCAPCIASFPKISKLQERYADDGVVVVSLSDENIDRVEQFLDSSTGNLDIPWRDRLVQTIATDPDQSTNETLKNPTGLASTTLPYAMIIGRTGTLEWIGIPTIEPLEPVLDGILAGEWDPLSEREKDPLTVKSLVARVYEALDAQDWAGAADLAGDDWNLQAIVGLVILETHAIASDEEIALATQLGESSMELSEGNEEFPYLLLAELAWRSGDQFKAVELQRTALMLASHAGSPWKDYHAQKLEQFTKTKYQQ
ncbi:MAG: TlpA family protein disulfide reductase [Planctomycetota bacterium]|jgi:thiol-disulfide isomerase/thioredoxin